MRLLVTRPEPEASIQAQELRDLGHEPVVQPLLQFQRLDFDPAPLMDCGALVLTSGNSLRAISELELSAISGVPLFCVGSETARRARSAGFRSIAATADTAGELSTRIVARVATGTKLVHVTGEHHAFDLEKALIKEGLSMCTLRVYAMAARRAFESHVVEGMRSGTIGGAILMSPRTAEILVSLCRTHDLSMNAKSLRYFCLAQSVAERLESIGPTDVSIAAKPNRAALLALIAAPPLAGHDCVRKNYELKP
jgi:uroporphyrinogen-III synthase